MAICRSTPPLIVSTLAVVCFFLSSPPFPFAAAKKFELATQICKNTTDFDFCRAVVFPDPRAAAADRVDLAYIVFSLAYTNSTSTQEYIERKIKSVETSGGANSGGVLIKGLKKCRGYYQEASRILFHDMLQNLDSESYFEFDKDSINVEDQARACGKGFGSRSSPMTKRNDDLVKLANICYAVSLNGIRLERQQCLNLLGLPLSSVCLVSVKEWSFVLVARHTPALIFLDEQ